MGIVIKNSNICFGPKSSFVPPPPPLLDPDAVAFLTASGIVDSTIEGAINNLVVDMKTAGIWTKMKAIYPFVGGTSTTHKWNLKDPRDLDAAFRLTFFGGVTHNSDSIQGNAVNGYADTHLLHNSTRDFGGISSYIINNISENSTVIRVDSGSAIITQILPRWTDNVYYSRLYSQSNISLANLDSKGFYGLSRINTTTIASNFKGVQNNYIINNVSIGTDRSYFVMAGHSALGTAERFSSFKIAFTTIHHNMTATDLENLRIAVQTFQTTLGRQV